MIKRMLALTSSVFFAAGTTPWPVTSTHHVTPHRNTTDETNGGSTNVLLAAVRNRNRRTLPMSVDFFRETRRLQEIHFAVTEQSMVPVWQDPRTSAFQQRLKVDKVRGEMKLSAQTPKKNATPTWSKPLSSRGSSPLLQQAVAGDLGVRISGMALSLVGRPYRWGGESPSGFDCSGLVQYVYRKEGIYIPRTSFEQAKVGVSVALSSLRPGDLIFFSTSGPGASHVAIYVGNGLIVQALNQSSGVIVSHLNAAYFQRHFWSARRIVV